MIEFFAMCLQMAYAFKGSSTPSIPDTDQFMLPLKKYIADHVHRLLLGVAPYSIATIICNILEHSGTCIETEINLNDFGAQSKIILEEVCKKNKEKSIKSGKYTNSIMNQVVTVCTNLDVAVRKRGQFNHIKESINSHAVTIKYLQTILTAHSWFHEEMSCSTSTFRNNFVHQLKAVRKNLTAWKSTIDKMREEIITCITTVMQRLKWAAGANPEHAKMLATYEKQSTAKRDELDKNCLLAAVALKACISIINYESLRCNFQENFDQDQQFLNHVSHWEKCCIMSQSCSNAVSPIEEAIVELLDPEGTIDIIWLNNVKALLNDMTEQTEEDLNQYEKNFVTSTDNLQKCGHKLRQLLSIHHQLSSDVISLLKTTLKSESDYPGELKEYLGRYKQFIDTLSEVHGTILSKDFTDENVSVVTNQMEILNKNCNGIYDDLFWFEHGMTGTRELEDRDSSSSPTKQITRNEKSVERFYGSVNSPKKGKGRWDHYLFRIVFFYFLLFLL